MRFTFAPDAKPLPGYTIKRAIDRGGFGEVYYALSEGGKEVALKLLTHQHDVELRGLRQCLNLKHPHLVDIYDIRTDEDENHWVIMEYMAGPSLEQVLAQSPHGLPLSEIEVWLQGMCAGAAYLHEQGIVHRDLKPGNVFREGDQVKIGDVGLSKFITPSRRSQQTESVGTVYYMAPEVARGKYGSELDIYSLGVMLFEMATGDVPFQGESTAEILMKHLTEPPDLSRLTPALRPVVARALEKDPQKRTATPQDLWQNFCQAVHQAPAGRTVPSATHGTAHAGAANGTVLPAIPRTGPFPPPVLNGRRNVDTGAPTNSIFLSEEPAALEARKRPEFENMPTAQAAVATRGAAAAAAGWGPQSPRAPRNGHADTAGQETPARPTMDAHVQEQRNQAAHSQGMRSVVLVLLALVPLLWYFGGRGWIVTGERVLLLSGGAAFVVYWGVRRLTEQFPEVFGGGENWGPAPATEPRAGNGAVVPVALAKDRAAERDEISTSGLSFDVYPGTKGKRAGDLMLSMVMASLLSVAATLMIGFLTPLFGFQNRETFARGVFFAAVSILTSWLLLGMCKVAETRSVQTQQRRSKFAAAGIAFGVGIYLLGEFLMVHIPFEHLFSRGVFQHVGRQPLLTHSLEPTVMGFSVFFGGLFGLRRWWWLAHPLRARRFSIKAVLFTTLVAFVWTTLLAFPQNWGVLWGATIATVVQLSAMWIPPEKRHYQPQT